MSQLDDLLARGRSPGKFVERRKFTLSRDKAIEKQREFALRHPRQYILELVQAAVFSQATYIAVDARPGSVLVAWVGGTPFTQRELSNLLDYLFADRTDPKTRHLVQLAVGVNAILQREPRTLRVETGDGNSSVRVDLDHSGNGTVGTVEDPIAGTYLYAEFGGGWFSRFTGNTQTKEQELIEERCLYTPVPILLNGRAPFGYRGTRRIEIFGARRQAHFDKDGRRGVVALHSNPTVTGYRMVVGGVWVSTLSLPEIATRPLVGVVCDDGLRKTADHSDVVQDWRFGQMLHAVQPHATRVMRDEVGSKYKPPGLPRVTVPDDEPAGAPRDEVDLEPLPEPLPAQSPRAPVPLNDLRVRIKRWNDEQAPLWCTPQVSRALERHADPHRFPFPLLVLTAGQAASLEKELPGVGLSRISARADIDFVRRVLERQAQMREHSFMEGKARITLRLHLEGTPPDWGEGRAGVPWCAVHDEMTVSAGSIHSWVEVATEPAQKPRQLITPLALTGVSVLIENPPDHNKVVTDHLVDRVLAQAWHLALPPGGAPDRPLLAGLLGLIVVPQLVDQPRAGVAVSLPVDHPDSVRTAPLAMKSDGTVLTLAEIEGLPGTDDVIELANVAELTAVRQLEQRLGYGHLWHPSIAGKPAWGVGHVGHRWVWLDSRDAWKQPMSQVIFVGSTFRPRLGDDSWRTEAHPHPVLVYAVRNEVEPSHIDAGWDLLFRELLRLELADGWDKTRNPHGISSARGRHMGRLALIELAAAFDHLDEPLFLPTDGGARRSLRALRSDPSIRLVARHGVQVSEPRTIALTADERRSISRDDAKIALRYDDPPEVWQSLARGSETGWLVRQHVREGGLSGWLGLRHPYDATTGLLVRATGRLIAIPELDKRIPCHGLLWPEGEARVPTPEQEQLLQLAGLRLYQSLIELLANERDPEKLESARRYATAFAVRSTHGGGLPATARELARRVEVRDADGSLWGTLENWLGAPAQGRPGLPENLHELARQPMAAELPTADNADGVGAIRDRLEAALGDVEILFATTDSGPAIDVMVGRSTEVRVAMKLNQKHRLVIGATSGDRRLQEVLILEAARQVCDWLRAREQPADLLAAQQKLIAQRLQAG